jgi:hypothetical protein
MHVNRRGISFREINKLAVKDPLCFRFEKASFGAFWIGRPAPVSQKTGLKSESVPISS